MKCIDPTIGRLITRYEMGMLDESERDAFVEHVFECAYCHDEVYSMAPHMAAVREHREAVLRGSAQREQPAPLELLRRTPPPWTWRNRAALLAASVVVLVGGAVTTYLVLPGKRSGTESILPSGIVVPKAAYAPPASRLSLRGPGGSAAFEEGMTSYLNEDYASASKQLEVAARLDPENSDAHFYQGVSLLLLDRAAEAIGPLKRAVEMGTGASLERSRYYLALAYLRTNKPDGALDELRKVIEARGELWRQSERLKAMVERSMSPAQDPRLRPD